MNNNRNLTFPLANKYKNRPRPSYSPTLFIVKYYYLFFSNPDVLVKSAKEGVERVKKGSSIK